MQKVALIAHNSIKEELLEQLHRSGVLEISERREPVPVDHTDVNFRTAELQFALDTLKDFASKQTLAAAGKPADEKDIIFAVQHTDVRGIVDELHQLEESDTEGTRRIKDAESLINVLSPWNALPYDMSASRETESSLLITGTLPAGAFTLLDHALVDDCPRTEITALGDEQHVVAHVWKTDKNVFEEIATKHGWTTVDLPRLEGRPMELIEKAQLEKKELESQIRKNADKRVQLSVELPNLVKANCFMHWLHEKQSAREAMTATSSTVTLLGWIPKKNFADLEKQIEEVSTAVALLKIKPDEGEEAPVLLKNMKWVTPFESVTNLYGLPLYSEGDPTASLSPFFALYFALCLTDAGYGAIIALIFGITLLKTKKSIDEAPLLWLLFIGGIITFLVSIPFGGWFGLAPSQVPEALTKTTADGELLFRGQIWNLSSQSGIAFLQNLSLALGITHLSFGMFLAGWHKWIHGKKAEAFWVDFTPHVVIGSALVFAFAPEGVKQYALYALYASLVLLVWGKGYGSKIVLRPVMGFLGVMNLAIGLLSNTLSYLRLLALGLVTGAIAMAINQVAVEMGKLFPLWIGIPVIVLIFVAGHTVSIALNTLGSFIHSGRLQFIEFFSQFFEGGGRGYAPFKRTDSVS